MTYADWKAAVERELGGKSFEDALVRVTREGVRVQPLYTESVALPGAVATREPGCLLCVRCRDAASVREAIDGGADAIWLEGIAADGIALDGKLLVDDTDTVSSLDYHARGADSADEIAVLLARGVARLRAGERVTTARIAVGRDTFTELCKLRALRLCWQKILVACGVLDAAPLRLHAVGATQTLAARDPWVNLLRGTTQVFAALLGGADLVTPSAFDDAIGADTALGRRVARNTALVLRDESHLSRVVDPAAGSYYLDAHTDALARAAWARWQTIEREGGIGAAFDARIASAWHKREAAIAKRKEPVLGVSEFANLDETRPVATTASVVGVRDSAAFETLRDRAEALASPTVTLVALGPPAEHRARVGFAEGLFPTAGLRTVRGDDGVIACLCGSDERYAAEAADRARALKASGSKRVLLAGRPGALEASLREAGVDDFIFLGCDVIATTRAIVEVLA